MDESQPPINWIIWEYFVQEIHVASIWRPGVNLGVSLLVFHNEKINL